MYLCNSEVGIFSYITITVTYSLFCNYGITQVSETEREDLEESEKTQHWVEKLCQTRLEQISSVENDSPDVKSCSDPPTVIPEMAIFLLLFWKLFCRCI